MSKTKTKILICARKLLNEKGLSAVSQRTIASYMNISPGNLTYHYKKRSDIIEALYFELVSKMNQFVTDISESEKILEGLYYFTKVMMEQFYEYRFLFLDFIQIMRENAPIKKHYMELLEIRHQQFTSLLQILINMGLMHEEELPNEYSFLIKRMTIFGDFWLASAELNCNEVNEKQIEEYLKMSYLIIYPYLTTEGKKKYLKIVQ